MTNSFSEFQRAKWIRRYTNGY